MPCPPNAATLGSDPEHADLLYDLAGQVVEHLKSYLSEEDVLRLLQGHQQPLVQMIHTQMQDHYEESATEYEAHVSRGFKTLQPASFALSASQRPRHFREPVDEKQLIRGMVFGGFKKCLYPAQKFHSDSERRFSVVLENDPDVIKWFRPSRGDLQIHYSHEAEYEPDFVVEMKTGRYLCEPKAANEMQDADVQAKARAAVTWCSHATRHAQEHREKPWAYLLIPHDKIDESKSFAGFVERWTYRG